MSSLTERAPRKVFSETREQRCWVHKTANVLNKLPQSIQTKALKAFDFPAEHWRHLRTTNPIEPTFATVRLRHRRTKGSGSRGACPAMVFKLAQIAQRGWRRLTGAGLIVMLLEGHHFVDGIAQKKEEKDAV